MKLNRYRSRPLELNIDAAECERTSIIVWRRHQRRANLCDLHFARVKDYSKFNRSLADALCF